MAEHKNIGEALIAVASEVGYVHKSGSMTFGERYNYAGEADFIRVVRPALVAHGIVGPIPVEIIRCEIIEHAPSKRGAAQFRCDVVVAYDLLHGASGTTQRVMAAGCGVDQGDKATPKALTGAYKYALRQALCIETGDDPDRERIETEERKEVTEHHPSFDDTTRVNFCTTLTRRGMSYDVVAYLTQNSSWKKRPSAMTNDERAAVLKKLAEPGGRSAYDEAADRYARVKARRAK